MRQQPLPRDTFFSLKNDSQILERPISVATEFVDTDWEEEDEIISDEEDNSPRISLQSVCNLYLALIQFPGRTDN